MEMLCSSSVDRFSVPQQLSAGMFNRLEGLHYGNKDGCSIYMDKKENYCVPDRYPQWRPLKSCNNTLPVMEEAGGLPPQKATLHYKSLDKMPYSTEKGARTNASGYKWSKRLSQIQSEHIRRSIKSSGAYCQNLQSDQKESSYHQYTKLRDFDNSWSSQSADLSVESTSLHVQSAEPHWQSDGQHIPYTDLHRQQTLNTFHYWASNSECPAAVLKEPTNMDADLTRSPYLTAKHDDVEEDNTSVYFAPCDDSDSDMEYVDEKSILAEHRNKYLTILDSSAIQNETKTDTAVKELVCGNEICRNRDIRSGLKSCHEDSSGDTYRGWSPLRCSVPSTVTSGNHGYNIGNNPVDKSTTFQNVNIDSMENFVNGISEQADPIDYSIQSVGGKSRAMGMDFKLDPQAIGSTLEQSCGIEHANEKGLELNGDKPDIYIDTVARLGCVFVPGMSKTVQNMSNTKARKDYILRNVLKKDLPNVPTCNEQLRLNRNDVEMFLGKNVDVSLFVRPTGYKKTLEDFLNKRIADLINVD